MNKITLLLVLFSAPVIAGCTPQSVSTPLPTVTPTPSQLIGGDKDSHGCIGSAGYTWCQSKNKCLRVWEEACPDETDLIKTTIKQAIVAKHGPTANNLTISVSKIVGNYSSGGASEVGSGGGMWFAAKVNGQWNLVWDGNGIITCTDLASYPDFPSSLIPECYDQETEKMIKRLK